MPLPRPMTHVNPRHVHSPNCQRLQLLEPARGGPDSAYQLRAPRAAEPVLLQLRLRHRVDLDRGGVRRGPIELGDEDWRGGGGGVVEIRKGCCDRFSEEFKGELGSEGR